MNNTMRLDENRFTLEIRLLLTCLSLVDENEKKSRIKSLASKKPDWDLFLSWVARHKVIHLAWDGLKTADPDVVPEAIKKRMEQYARSSVYSAMRVAQELMNIVDLLEKEKLPFLTLKGVGLSILLYGDPVRRGGGDIDLFLGYDQMDAFDKLVRSNGYIRTIPSFEATPRQLSSLMVKYKHFTYVKANGGVPVEVHWRISNVAYKSRFDFDKLYENRQTLELGSKPLPCLGLDDLYHHCLIHGLGHNWFRLKWLVDIARLSSMNPNLALREHPQPDIALGLKRAAASSELLAHKCLNSPAPEALKVYAKKDKAVAKLLNSSQRHLTVLDTKQSINQLIIDYYLMNGILAPSFRQKTAILKELLEPSSICFKKVQLPDSLFPLYYPLHLFLTLGRLIKPIQGEH